MNLGRGLIVATAVMLVVSFAATARAIPGNPAMTVRASYPCLVGSCSVDLTYRPAADLPEGSVVEVDWDHSGPAATGFVPDGPVVCPPSGASCRATSPVYTTAGSPSVVARLTTPGGAPRFTSQRVSVKRQTQSYGEECGPARPDVNCGPGNGRRTPGGAAVEKVGHVGWPAISGILWHVMNTRVAQRKTGGRFNDELLGHHGNDTLSGGPGDDILWGDWDPVGNTTRQVDRMNGNGGNDWIYASHGRNTITGGSGEDFVYAYFGHGTIDCGPGLRDTAKIRTTGDYRTRNCEIIRNFCGFGQRPGGGCYKPGENPRARRAR